MSELLITLFWAISLLASLLSLAALFSGLAAVESAPQECSAAAIALAVAVIPYCLARAVKELN